MSAGTRSLLLALVAYSPVGGALVVGALRAQATQTQASRPRPAWLAALELENRSPLSVGAAAVVVRARGPQNPGADAALDDRAVALAVRLADSGVPVLLLADRDAASDAPPLAQRFPLATRGTVHLGTVRLDNGRLGDGQQRATGWLASGGTALAVLGTAAAPLWQGDRLADAERIAREAQEGAFSAAYEARRAELLGRGVRAWHEGDLPEVGAVGAELVALNPRQAEGWLLSMLGVRDPAKPPPPDAFVVVDRATRALRECPRQLHAFLAAAVLADEAAPRELAQAALRALTEFDRSAPLPPALQIDRVRALLALGKDAEAKRFAQALRPRLADAPELQRRLRRATRESAPAETPSELAGYLSQEADRSFGKLFLETHAHLDDADAAELVGRLAIAEIGEPMTLNGVAWYMAGIEGRGFEGRYARLALETAEQMATLPGWRDAATVDTYAAVAFEYGLPLLARDMQRESLRLGGGGDDYKRRLQKYERTVNENARGVEPMRPR